MNIEKDTAELLLKCIVELSKALDNKEKALIECSEETKQLINEGITHVKGNRIENALRCFYEVIKKEPRYSRVRLQLLSLHKKQGDHVSVISLGGNTLAYASDGQTRCQIYGMMGDATAKLYAEKQDQQKLDNALWYYENAISSDNSDPVPLWNMTEFLYKIGMFEKAKMCFLELSEVMSKSGGKYCSYIDQISKDARIVLPREEPWITIIEKLELANNLFLEPDGANIVENPVETKKQKSVLTICMIVTALIGAPVVSTAIVSSLKKPSEEIQSPKSNPNNSGKSPSLKQSVIDEIREKHDAQSIDVSEVDYDLTDLAAVDYDPDDLA